MNRIDALKQIAFEKNKFDGFLVSNSANLLYFTGFLGTVSLLIPKDGESKLYVYSVNYEYAKANGKNFLTELVNIDENLMAKIARQTREWKTKKLAIDALNLEGWRSLSKETRDQTKLGLRNNFVRKLREVKDEKEIELMRKAGDLTSEGMKAAYEVLKPGMKEYEVAAEIEYVMRKRGSSGTAFETSVASGVNSAFPHGGCSDRQIREGNLVVIDLGATYQSYCSDMTRTLVAGKPSEKQKRIYKIVKMAQKKAFGTIKPKVAAKEVDGAARKIIENAGYGEFFVHGLGHGVGLEIHEPPTLNKVSKDVIEVGNVITNEPGVYIVGYGGVRIEDTVLVRKDGVEKLTRGPYSLGLE